MKVAFDSSVIIAGAHALHQHHHRALVWNVEPRPWLGRKPGGKVKVVGMLGGGKKKVVLPA